LKLVLTRQFELVKELLMFIVTKSKIWGASDLEALLKNIGVACFVKGNALSLVWINYQL